MLSFVYLHTGQVIDKGKFFAARFARLYPLYIVVVVLDTPELLFTEIHRHGVSTGLTKTAEIFAANVLMLQAWLPLRLNQINLPSWSLCGEVFFYLCFPLLGVWLWKLHGRRLWLMMLVVYLGGQALFLTALHHLNPITAFCWPVLQLSTFTLGILLALCIGLGLLSFHYFETPIRLSLMEWFHRRSAKTTSRTTTLQAADLP